MMYALEDLLKKMGTPEALERTRVEWHYFDKAFSDLAGFAEVRIEGKGARVVAELRQVRENVADDHGIVHAQVEESFRLVASRMPGGLYKIETLSFDGAEYANPPRNITELGLSVFHARALDISILMVEQMFNKHDITDVAAEPEEFVTGRRAIFARLDSVAQRASFGVVIPFRPREALRATG